MSGHVFVSHGSEDSQDADALAAFIESRGMRAWIAPRDVRPGQDYSEQLQEALESCAAFVVLVSDKANRSPYVRAETEMAFSNGKPIFPIRNSDIQPGTGLAFFLKIRHWTDAFGPGRDTNLARLARELQAATGTPVDPPRTTAPSVAAPPPQAPAPPPPPAPIAAPAPQYAPQNHAPPAAAPDESLMLAAIGPNSAYYLERWRQMDERGTSVNWNWPACLVNLLWFAYRKMWGPMIGLILVFLLLGAIGASSATAGQVTLFVSIGISFVTGAFGNLLYRKQTSRLIAETSALGGPAQVEALHVRGGVSRVALFVLLGIVVVLTLLAIVVAVEEARRQQAGALGTENGIQPVYGAPNEQGGAAGEKPPLTDQELRDLQRNY